VLQRVAGALAWPCGVRVCVCVRRVRVACRTLTLIFQDALATAKVLLQTMPQSMSDQLQKRLIEVSTMVPGVLDVRSSHFWTFGPGVYVGHLCVQVTADVSGGVRDVV
jgi:Co/Zn/Cd efflux system component